MTNQEILKYLRPKEEYRLEVEKMHKELGDALFTGTLNNDELDELSTRICERIAIVKFIERAEHD